MSLKQHSIDILINNAGTIKREEAAQYSEENWHTVMDVNINSLFFLTQKVGQQMLKKGKENCQYRFPSIISRRCLCSRLYSK